MTLYTNKDGLELPGMNLNFYCFDELCIPRTGIPYRLRKRAPSCEGNRIRQWKTKISLCGPPSPTVDGYLELFSDHSVV